MIFEIDGEQHFDDKKFNGKYYKEQIQNDIIKNKFAKHIPIIRVSYSEYCNFEKIITWTVLNSTTIEKKLYCFGVEYISSDMEIEENLTYKV